MKNLTDLTDVDLFLEFKVQETVAWLKANGFQNVCVCYLYIFVQIGLQFPDNMLPVAARICEVLTSLSGKFCFILCDSSFSSCCIDEIAGQRFSINALIHYGHSCLTSTDCRLPVLYVFTGAQLSSPRCCTELNAAASALYDTCCANELTPLLITYDFDQQHLAHELCENLANRNVILIWSEPCLPDGSQSATRSPYDGKLSPVLFTRCARNFYLLDCTTNLPDPPWTLVHVGRGASDQFGDSLPLYRALLSLPEVDYGRAYHLNVDTLQLNRIDQLISGLLKRRVYFVEKAKEAQLVGILVGTLSAANYRDILKRIQTILELAGRSHVTLFVGRLNAAKLTNLPQLDLLVLIACPESSLLESRELFIPVVTPFELECALNVVCRGIDLALPERLYTGEKYWINFRDLLIGGAAYCPVHSLVPASSDDPAIDSFGNGESSDALAERTDWTIANNSNAANGFLCTWYGLDTQLGQTPVAVLRQGSHGVPTGYSSIGQPATSSSESTRSS